MDPLYGLVPTAGLLGDLLLQPEVQRLREVRLSNINSLTLSGCSGLSRFEHSVGTAFLAWRAGRNLGLTSRDAALLIAAGLLHDIGITPFGHLMEESFRYSALPFDHEKRVSEIFAGDAEYGNLNFQLFRGRSLGTRAVLARREWKEQNVTLDDIFQLIQGESTLGPLINGTVDLDNIDNVCRMAYHIGLPFRKDLPGALVEGFYFSGDELCFDEDKLVLLQEWLRLRRELYTLLMTNQWDFSAKAMLVEGIRRALCGHGGYAPVLSVKDWRMTDAELLQALADFPPSKTIVDRLERGELYDMVALHWIHPKSEFRDRFTPDGAMEHRRAIAELIGTSVDDTLVYIIKDKRTRVINNLYFGSPRRGGAPTVRPIGEPSRAILFGVALAQEPKEESAGRAIAKYLESVSGEDVRECDSEAYAAELIPSAYNPQLTLF